MSSPLALHVPEPITGHPISVETNPRAVKAWLVSLPPAQTAETARAIFDALTTLNRFRLDADPRLKLLEHYQVAIDMLDGPLETIYSSAAAPVKEKARQAATLARNLQLELANGYKLALTERLAARFSFGKRDVPELIYRLMQVYLKLLWVCSKSYSPMPAGVWQECHSLFHYAIQHKLIDGPEGAEHSSKTIAGCYKQILLLALVDPYRFHPIEHEKIRDLIRNYGASAQFQPLGQVVHPAGFFLIRLDQDSPPVFLGHKPQEVDASNAILLDTMDMAKLLNKALHSVEQKLPSAGDRAKAQAWIELLRRVTRQWSIAPKRTFQRIRANSRVQMMGGLRMTAFYLNGAQPLFQPLVLDGSEEMPENPPTLQGSQYGPPDHWQLLNESPGGFALRLKPIPQNGVYRVGDVVGLRSHEDDAWMVACVRWLQTAPDGEALEIGIQVLAPHGAAAMLRPTISHSGTRFQPSLLLPELAAVKQPALIVAPRGTFSPLRELAIYTEEGEQLVRAVRLHEQAVGFDLFEYSVS